MTKGFYKKIASLLDEVISFSPKNKISRFEVGTVKELLFYKIFKVPFKEKTNTAKTFSSIASRTSTLNRPVSLMNIINNFHRSGMQKILGLSIKDIMRLTEDEYSYLLNVVMKINEKEYENMENVLKGSKNKHG